ERCQPVPLLLFRRRAHAVVRQRSRLLYWPARAQLPHFGRSEGPTAFRGRNCPVHRRPAKALDRTATGRGRCWKARDENNGLFVGRSGPWVTGFKIEFGLVSLFRGPAEKPRAVRNYP